VHHLRAHLLRLRIQAKPRLEEDARRRVAPVPEIFPALAKSRIKQVSLECIHSKVPIELLKLLKGRDVLVGCDRCRQRPRQDT